MQRPGVPRRDRPARRGAPSGAALLAALGVASAVAWLELRTGAPVAARAPETPRPAGGAAPVARPVGRAPALAAPGAEAREAIGLFFGRLRGDGAPMGFEATVDLALDPTAPVRERLRAVARLAEIGDPAARAALERVLDEESHPAVLIEAAAALAREDRVLREALLADPDDAIAVGALRATGELGEADALAAVLADRERSEWVRAEAARALGRSGDPSASAHLIEVTAASSGDELRAAALEGLGARPFAETEAFFRAALEDPRWDSEARQRAIETLSAPGAAGWLFEVAASSPDEGVRASAVGSLAALDLSPGDLRRLPALLAGEASPDVRAAIYAALASQPRDALPDPGELLAVAHSEASPHARLHAYRAVASRVSGGGDPALAERFDAGAVPWLEREAEAGASPYARRLALLTLALAETPDADRALAALGRGPAEEIAAAAQDLLDRRNGTRGESPPGL